MQEHEKNNVQQNLKNLLKSCDSVADFCRRTGINRQQFNKYLAGQHSPSRATLMRIAGYFQLTLDDFYLSPIHFQNVWQSRDAEASLALTTLPAFNRFLSQARATSSEMEAYFGIYYRYHYSSIYKGQLLRSITHIYPKDGMVLYSTIERFPHDGEPDKAGYVFRYSGFCVLMGDRIFMVDSEEKQNNEITFTVLTPQHRRPIRYLHGLMSGIAATSYRQPFSSRIIFQRVDEKRISKSLLQTATILNNHSGIAKEILDYLDDEQTAILWGGAG